MRCLRAVQRCSCWLVLLDRRGRPEAAARAGPDWKNSLFSFVLIIVPSGAPSSIAAATGMPCRLKASTGANAQQGFPQQKCPCKRSLQHTVLTGRMPCTAALPRAAVREAKPAPVRAVVFFVWLAPAVGRDFSWAVVAVAALLFAGSLAFLLCTALLDPGFVPRDPPDEVEMGCGLSGVTLGFGLG